MKFLVLLTPAAGKAKDDFQPHMIAEIEAVWMSYLAGDLREFYFSPDPQVVTLVFEANDSAAVNRKIDELPMVEAGLLDRQIVHLGPFHQFQALFAGGAH